MEKTKPKYGATSAVGAAAGVVAVTAGTTVAGWWILSTQQFMLQHASVCRFVSWAHLLWPTLILGTTLQASCSPSTLASSLTEFSLSLSCYILVCS